MDEEFLRMVDEAILREMAAVDLVEHEHSCWALTEKGFEWFYMLERLVPKSDDPKFKEVLKNARTRIIKPSEH